MSKKLLFAMVITAVAGNTYADATTQTVTTQNYVDTQVATKQTKIDATGANFTNGSVVETTSTPGVVTQRGIFNPETDTETSPFGGVYPKQGHENDLVTAEPFYEQMGEFQSIVRNHTHKIFQECAEYVANAAQTPENCLLWYVPSTETSYAVYAGMPCNTSADCGNRQYCREGTCMPEMN